MSGDEKMLISVAMTCYNQAHYIKDAIKSITEQSYKNWELVIVNDCSTDKSVKKIKNCIKQYGISDKVKVIDNKKNVGYGQSLHKAISNCSGELVAVVDSDDSLAHKDVLKISVEVHENNPDASLTYSNYNICRNNLTIKKPFKTRALNKGETFLKPIPITKLKPRLRVSHLKVLKKKCYDMTEGINPKLKQTVDKDLVLKLEETGKLVFINDILYNYRHHSKNLSRTIQQKPVKYRKFVSKMRSEIYNSAKKRRAKQKKERKLAAKKQKNSFRLKIFVDGSTRSAVNRMFPIWRALGHEIVTRPKEANVQLSVIKISNNSGLPTVLRLDGVYYDLADDYTSRNAVLSKAHAVADAVIYQSETSRKMCEKYLSKRKSNIFEVIHNGIDENQFGFKKHEGINIVTCAKWRRWKRLPETIEIFKKFLSKRKYAKLHVIGPMSRGTREIPYKNVIYHGRMDFDQIKQVYKTADVYLHLAKKDSCPSSVVEAIGAGIPVITTNACGGATEMCKLTEGCIVIEGDQYSFEPDYIYQDKYNTVSKEVRDAIVRAIIKIEDDGRRVKIPKTLTIEYAAEQYLNVMKRIVKEKR